MIVYQVLAQEINLDHCCLRVLVATPAVNALSEVQAWSSIVQVSHTLFLYWYKGETDFSRFSKKTISTLYGRVYRGMTGNNF